MFLKAACLWNRFSPVTISRRFLASYSELLSQLSTNQRGLGNGKGSGGGSSGRPLITGADGQSEHWALILVLLALELNRKLVSRTTEKV